MSAQQLLPDVKAYSMAEFFTSTYKVPKYQRNYTWSDREVGELVDDLLNFDKSNEPFYLLGDVIAAHGDDIDYKFELVDGQQRATTMCLLFMSLYIKLTELGFDPVDTNQVLNAFLVRKGKLRILMSGQASDLVASYFETRTLEGLEFRTPSQKNVAEALYVIKQRLDDAFPGTSRKALAEFTEKVLQRVFFGRLTLGDVDQATIFFERVNNRGIKLTNADLLKNRILQKIVKDEEYEAAASTWAAAEQSLMSRGRLGSVEYLLRHLQQAKSGEKIKESDLYLKTKADVATESGCLSLIERIDQTYPILAKILDGLTPSGNEDAAGHGTRYFGFNQHFGVKLVAGHLPEESYVHLSKRLEARSIISLLAGERPSAFENDVPDWEKAVAQLNKNSSFEEIDAALAFSERQMIDLLNLSLTQYKTYRYDGTPGQQKRIRYILAKANHILSLRGPVVNFSLKEYLTTSRTVKRTLLPGFDIDHIHPKSHATESFEVHGIGNLALLHSADNQEKGASNPSDAATLYGHSKCYLTKALTSFPQTPQIEAIIAEYRVASADGDVPWGEAQVTARAKMYFEIVASSLIEDIGLNLSSDEVFSGY